MSTGFKVLMQHVTNLEDLLEDTDLIKLSKELLRHRIISKEFCDRFPSMDHDHLESDIKVRYLLKQVCERVKEDGEVLDRLVRVLGKVGGKVRAECEAMKSELGKMEGNEVLSGTQDTHLVEQDVPDLVECLVSGSHLWDAIGIALNLPKHKREDCGEGKENVNRLSNILTAWILGGYEGARAATLSSLRAVLASETVGLGKLARDLSIYKTNENPLPASQTTRSCPSIICQSYDTEVPEGKSTLVEVQVSDSGRVSFQWSKDGEPLLDGADFSGVCSNILYINRASQCTQGGYFCQVSRGSEKVHSDKMCLKVLYPPEKEKLLDYYSLAECEVPKDSWPPVGNSMFINLVLITPKPNSTYKTVYGDMDKTLESKEVAEYEDVFKEFREGALVVIEGRPGSGKTTLVYKLTRDWATGKNVLQGARMVFLITLRLLNVSHKDESLLNLLQIFYGKILSKQIEQNLQEDQGRRACFILDGLDEYKSKEQSIIYPLIHQMLPHSMVIVASRPVATEELKKECKMQLEVVGFSNDQIFSYVRSYPFCDSPANIMASKMKEFLDQHPNVLHMCYLPVHAAMICFLFSELEGNIPHRETQIYEQFVIATLLRYKTRMGEKPQLKLLKDLTGKEKDTFHSICKLAFDMISKSQQVVSKSDAQFPFSSDSLLGLLTVERTCKHYGFEDLYTFQHLTLQEFLAAFYIIEAEVKDRTLLTQQEFKNVFKFYCGLSKSEANIKFCEHVISCHQHWHHNNFYKIQCAYESQQVELCDHAVKKIKAVKMSDIVMKNGVLKSCDDHDVENSVISLNGFITISDFIALRYVMSNTTKPVQRIVLHGDCQCDIDQLRSLQCIVDKYNQVRVRHLKVDFFVNDEEKYEMLNCLLGFLPFFEELDLIKVPMDGHHIECIAKEVKLPHLKALKFTLSDVPFSNPEEIVKLLAFGSHHVERVYISLQRCHPISYVVWKKILCCAFGPQVVQESDMSWLYVYNCDNFHFLSSKRLNICTDIVLVNCCIVDEGAEILAKTLNISILEKLYLDFNRISDSGAMALADCLSKCSVVQEVSIQCNSIGDSGAIALADAFVHCKHLSKLNVQGNILGDKGAVAIAKATRSLPCLQLLLHNVNITEDGIEKILDFRPSASIKSMAFTLSWDKVVSEADIDSLRNALCCGNIPELKLSSTNIYKFEKLVLSGLKSVSGIDARVIKEDYLLSLCLIMENLENLKHICCSLLDIKSTGAVEKFCESLKLCKSLNSVFFYNVGHVNILKTLGQHFHLKSLKISGCYIWCIPIFFLDLNCDTLQNISFHFCFINSTAIKVLNNVLIRCKSLRYLDLSYNNFGDEGAVALARGLKNHTTLLGLILGGNKITTSGVTALIPVIRQNHLNVVDFSCNCIDSFGIAVLLAACEEDTLQILAIHNNVDIEADLYTWLEDFTQLGVLCVSIESNGLMYLAEGLKHCTRLQKLEIYSKSIEVVGVVAILIIMRNCKYLHRLSLHGIGVDGAAVLVSGWQHKRVLTIDVNDSFSSRHGPALSSVEECCSDCEYLLRQYYNNDYVLIEIEQRTLPKLVLL